MVVVVVQDDGSRSGLGVQNCTHDGTCLVLWFPTHHSTKRYSGLRGRTAQDQLRLRMECGQGMLPKYSDFDWGHIRNAPVLPSSGMPSDEVKAP